MQRTLGSRIKWFLVVGGAATVACAVAPSAGVRQAIYVAAALQVVPVVVHAARRGRIGPRLTMLVSLVGLFYVLSQVFDGGAHQPLSDISDLLGASCIIAGLGVVIHRRRLHECDGVVGDALIVGLGSWIATWVIFLQPLIDSNSRSVPSSILYGCYLPATSVILFMAALILFGQQTRPIALCLITAALALNLGGQVLIGLVDARHIRAGAARFELPFYVAAYFCVCAAFMHPTARALGTPADRVLKQRQLGRLIITTSSLVLPVIVLAATQPHGSADQLVRAISAAVLAGAVTLRVVQTVRSNAATQDALVRGAQTDPLTGLPNRSVLLEQIALCLSRSWQDDRRPTVYFIDLDRFKNINDSLGHAAGDEVLMMVARRLRSAVAEPAIVARLSGDEYVVLEPESTSTSASMALAEALLAVFREPLALSHGDVFVTASIGMASLRPNSSSSAEDLLRHADTAMYRAKDAGRNCMALYDESMHERVAHRLAVETALYRALDRRELRMFHQPILDLDTGDVEGFEALMRWQQADGTIVSPAEFIPIAEDTGTIVPIGSWALLEALTQLRQWIDTGVCSSHATMSVNVSPRQLSDASFPGIVSEALTRAGVPASLLWLEVTEGVMIAEPELALATLRRLRSLGVRVALDDFGTGYSSLSLLQKFPLQRIKIDRAFVHGVADNPNDRSLVRTIVAMGRSLGLDIVAEGVESVHQMQVLNELGCTKAQGFLISHPVPAEAMRSTVAALERLGQVPGLRQPTPIFRSVG